MNQRILFSPDDQTDLVILNRYGEPHESLEFYAQAFYRAARQIADGYDGKTVRDIAMCPAIYLYRHALELYLKAILLAGVRLRDLRRMPPLDISSCLYNHRLPTLAMNFIEVANDMGWANEMPVTTIPTRADFLALIDEWDKFDQQSFSFRYPMNKSGDASLPERFAFSLSHFRERVEALLDLLDGCVTAVEQACDSLEEARSYHYQP